jgi:flagellar biosynthesis GTPase FlhF
MANLFDSVKKTCEKLKSYNHLSHLLKKLLNFMIQSKLDMVLMLVGPTGGGKTSVYKVL